MDCASGLLEGASILVLSVVTPPGIPLLPAPVAARLGDDARSAGEQTRAALGVNGKTTEVCVRRVMRAKRSCAWPKNGTPIWSL